MQSIFPQGYKGKSDSIFSGKAGSVLRSIGVDARSEPGKIKVQQALEKVSGSVVDKLATSGVRTAGGKNVWFGESGVFVDDNGSFSKKLDLAREVRDVMFTNASGSLTPNLTTAEYQEYTALADAFTLNAPTGGVAGDNFHLVVTATGANRAITFNASYQFLENNDAPTEIEEGFTYDFVITKTNSRFIISWGRVEN